MAPVERGSTHSWIRSNVLGLVAIFIALSGTAVATQVPERGDTSAQVAKKKKKAKRGPAGPAGPQGLQGAQGPTGPLTGPAGGALTGSYPNPGLAPGSVGVSNLTALGSPTTDTPPVEAVPVVLQANVSASLGPGTFGDTIIYSANAPRSMQIIDAWVVVRVWPTALYKWQFRDATGGGGSELTPEQALPSGAGRVGRLDTFDPLPPAPVIPSGGTLVVRTHNASGGVSPAAFDVYALAVPVP